MWGCWSFSSWPFFHGGGFGLGGILFGLLGLLAAVWLIRSLVTAGTHRQGARADRDDALRLLDHRLAAGAITPEEYERLRRAILS